jgi:hypothetical protein
MTLSGRQIAMQRLLEICKRSKLSDIDRASMFLEAAEDVRKGNRSNRTSSRASQASGAKRKAAKLDKPLGW